MIPPWIDDGGYYDGHQSSKIWLVSSEDLKHVMYRNTKQGNKVSLWAEFKSAEEKTMKSRRKLLNGKV